MDQNKVSTLEVTADLDGIRLDKGLSQLLPSTTRSTIVKAIAARLVLIDGIPADKASRKLRKGEQLIFREAPSQAMSAAPEDIPLQVVFEDEHLAVIDKPAGLVVHPARGHATGTLVNALVHRWQMREGDANLRFGIVHRLDKGTSGLLVVGRTADTVHQLQKQFQDRTVVKRYLAIVVGVPKVDSGSIDTSLMRHPRDRKRFTGKGDHGKEAHTEWTLVSMGAGISLLEVAIHTGRTHQIRVHLSEAGFPVLGDETYGGHWLNRIQPRPTRDLCRQIRRPMLHSAILSFQHPATGERMTFRSSPPPDMQRLIATLAEV